MGIDGVVDQRVTRAGSEGAAVRSIRSAERGSWPVPVHGGHAVARLAVEVPFVVTGGRPVSMDNGELREVERILLESLSSGSELPTMKELAAAVGVSRRRLRAAIGSVAEAAEALVSERLATAYRSVELPAGWHCSLSSLAERIVTHRLFVHSIVAGVLGVASRCRVNAHELESLGRALHDDLGYQIRRLRVFDEPALADRFTSEVEELLSFDRLARLSELEREQLERRLGHEMAAAFTRYGADERWNERRHAWFDPSDVTPARGVPVPVVHAIAS